MAVVVSPAARRGLFKTLGGACPPRQPAGRAGVHPVTAARSRVLPDAPPGVRVAGGHKVGFFLFDLKGGAVGEDVKSAYAVKGSDIYGITST